MRSSQNPLTGLFDDLRRLPGKLYEMLWKGTTGIPYTYIMRDHPWYLRVPAIIIVTFLAWSGMRHRSWWAILLRGAALFGLGFVFGHVFW